MAATGDQLPGCIIPKQCMLQVPGFLRGDSGCGTDLVCICNIDNHFGTNCVFSHACLLKACTQEQDRKSFLVNWFDSCREAGTSGGDNIPPEWEPYRPAEGAVPSRVVPKPMPSTQASSTLVATSTAAAATSLAVPSLLTLLTTTSTTSTSLSLAPTASSRTASSSTSASFDLTPATASRTIPSSPEVTSTPAQPIITTSKTLSPGAIGGIVAGILILVLLCAGLGYFYWKASKKVREKNREVAILNDRISGHGFQSYIDELLADSNSASGTVSRDN
ncbi:hypothetical protein C7974DRAFT_20842 [Boeremia exigua]|uniref:uncharacterized protein n=1 Tax=Boeremia exigua TaxID=749465 RepID=UPI001E8CE5C0|nr:uncharacterized protein C7974DRAFT_20842 [Boeremia exigua]KAH6644433.1 hypothetical protein C7974DRAFT_20842 [Boeremia exigua]